MNITSFDDAHKPLAVDEQRHVHMIIEEEPPNLGDGCIRVT